MFTSQPKGNINSTRRMFDATSIFKKVTCINQALIPAMCLQNYFNTIVTQNTLKNTIAICHDQRIFTTTFQPSMVRKIRIYSAFCKANNMSRLYLLNLWNSLKDALQYQSPYLTVKTCLRWTNTVFAPAFADAIQRAHKAFQKQTCRQQSD